MPTQTWWISPIPKQFLPTAFQQFRNSGFKYRTPRLKWKTNKAKWAKQ